MIWHSPNTGCALHQDTPHSLTDGQSERWPVVDGIPYLRTKREGLVALALRKLDAGDAAGALVALLADQDAWWNGPPTDLAELQELVKERDALTLRGAMALLRFGPVADYFAYRWSDPTYLAGLALLEAHWNHPTSCFELACGIGHYLRELARRGVACIGGDVVFAKCWLAKHWVAPAATLVCFDAGDEWPIKAEQFDLVSCQDAFYFLPDQPKIADRLRECVADRGVLAIGHLHNANVDGGALGPARSMEEWRSLFPDSTVYDEDELLRAMVCEATPCAAGWRDDPDIEAWSIIEGGGSPRQLAGGLAIPLPGSALRSNPLLQDGAPRWPSERYEREYAARSPWIECSGDAARTRRLVDLPERW